MLLGLLFFSIYFTLFQMDFSEYHLFTFYLASLSELNIHLWLE